MPGALDRFWYYVRAGVAHMGTGGLVLFACGIGFLLLCVVYSLLWGIGAVLLNITVPAYPPGGALVGDEVNLGPMLSSPGVALAGVGVLCGGTVVAAVFGWLVEVAPPRLQAWHDHLMGGDDA